MSGFRRAKAEQAALKISMYGAPGSGKAQPIDEPVLTPIGFVPIGTLCVGDKVIGRDGLSADVTGVFPQGVKEVFRVAFSDGTETRCCDEHLWVVRRAKTKDNPRWHVLPLKEVRLSMMDAHGTRWGASGCRLRIPVSDTVSFAPQSDSLPLAPYVLGCLLGDGCFRASGVAFSSMDAEIVDRMKLMEPTIDFTHSRSSPCNYYVRNCVGRIRSLGLHGTDSATKFIPDVYLTASAQDRLELLRGICDTDGHRTIGCVDVTVKSLRLAEGVAFLARSLGFLVSVRRRSAPKYARACALHEAGQSHAEIAESIGSTEISVATMLSAHRHHLAEIAAHPGYHRVVIRCDNTNQLLTLPRKQGEIRKGKYAAANGKVITEIEPVGKTECVCIAVDSEDRTYLTRDFIVTHNTFSALLVAEGLAAASKTRVAYVDTEHGTDFYAIDVPARSTHPQAFDFDALYTRSLTEVLAQVRKLDHATHGVIVIDSITHLWEAAIAAYAGSKTRGGGIPMHAWGKIKAPYKALMHYLVNCPQHVLILGRQANVFVEDEETGETKSGGVKMKAEGETQYEPHVCLRMEAIKPVGKRGQVLARATTIPTAFAEKDRSGVLQGQLIEWPSFANIAAPLMGLLGAKQAQVQSDDDAARQDADAFAQEERDRARHSRITRQQFEARIVLARTAAELKNIGLEITPSVKKAMLPDDVLSLRESYLSAEGHFKGQTPAAGSRNGNGHTHANKEELPDEDVDVEREAIQNEPRAT